MPTNSRKPPRPTAQRAVSQRPLARPARTSPPQPTAQHSPIQHPVLDAQEQAGNHAIQQLLRSGVIQPKLQVSQPGDSAELEAERVADSITQSSTAAPCSCSGSGEPCEECSKASGLHRAATAATPRATSASATHAVRNVLGGSGHPLDSASRAFFEPRFGKDFSKVRIHTGAQAAQSAQSIQARAYTHGSDIVFNSGEYQPSSDSGRHLLAHELTHVLHQSSQAATLHREAAPSHQSLKEEAEDLFHRRLPEMQMDEDFSAIAHELDFALIALRYDYVLEVFHQIPSRWEDNVGAELISITPMTRLKLYALSPQGRRMLNVIYEAIITGDVSEFERKQADKILEATQISQANYISQVQGQLLTFAVKNQGFLRDCYAVFSAELQTNGNVKVWYNSVRIWQCSEFKQDVATFPDDPTHPRELAPDTLVNVHLYDQGGVTIPVPAIALIDYANQSKNKTLSLAETAFITGFTVGMGGFGGTPGGAAAEGTAWGTRATAFGAEYGGVVESAAALAARAAPYAARIAFWADRIAVVLPILTSILEDNRDWIVENVPFGSEIVWGIEKANAIIAYYGYARLGVDGLRFAAGQMKGVLKARASGGIPASFNAEQRSILAGIDANSQELLSNLEKTEQAILEDRAAQQQAAPAPDTAAPGGGGRAASPAPEPAAPPPIAKPKTPDAVKPSRPSPTSETGPHTQPVATHQPSPVHEPAKPPKSTEHTQAPESAEPAKADPQTTAKPGDFTPEQLSDANQRLEDRIADPRNVRAAKPGSGYDLEVDLGDGQIYRRRPDGTWCLFRNPKLCGIKPGSAIATAAERQVARLETEEVIDDAVKTMVKAGQLDGSKADAMREHLRDNPEDLSRLLKMQGHPAAADVTLEHRIDRVIANQPAMDVNAEAVMREFLRTHPDRLEQLEALHSDTGAAQYGKEDMPERGEATYGGSAPVEAGKEGKDLSRAWARDANKAIGKPWIADELRFEFTMPDGTTRITIADIGMRGEDESGFLIDSKLGPNSGEEELQIHGYPEIAAGRAIPNGAAAEKFAKEIYPEWQPGNPMPATRVEIFKWKRVKEGMGEFGSNYILEYIDRTKYGVKP